MNMPTDILNEALAALSTTDGADAEVLHVALREAFRSADGPARARLRKVLPPCEVMFCGVQMYVDPRDNYTDLRIWLDGQPPEAACLNALIDMVRGQNALVLDIGANSGAYAVPLAAVAATGSRVIAFEPNPAMIGRLGHNITLNGLGQRVRIEGCALGDIPGEAVLHLKPNNYGEASFTRLKPRQRSGAVLVPVRSILDFAHEAEGHDVSVLKIDVEGFEVQALGPLLDAGGWLPDAILIESAHARKWEVDLCAVILGLGYTASLEAEGNTLYTRQDMRP